MKGRVRTAIVAAIAVSVVVPLLFVYGIQNAQIGLNFQTNPRIAPMYNIYFDRYMSPTSSTDCQWIGKRGIMVFAALQNDVTCFHQANPNIIVTGYIDRGVQTTDPLAVTLWNDETAWLHWQNGSRAYFTFSSARVYLPNPASGSVRTYEAANVITQWKTLGLDGVILDDGYYPCLINSVFKICSNGSPLAEFNNGDYLAYVQAWSNWGNWVKAQMGKPFHIYPNGVDWYTTINSTVTSAWLSGLDGEFLEYYPRPWTWADQVASYYRMQSAYAAANPKAVIVFFTYSGEIPSLAWLSAYYLLAKNFTTNNLYLSLPFSYPVPQGFCCEGWNPAVWDNLNLGNPKGAASIVDAFGDGTATLYVRIFQKGIVVAMQHRLATDARTITVNLPGSYVNVTNLSGPLVSNITIGVNNAFIGVLPGSQGVAPYAVPIFSPPIIAAIALTLSVVFVRRRLVKSSRD